MHKNPQFVRLESIVSRLIVFVLILVVPPGLRAQDGISKQAPPAQAEPELKVGSQVVLKASGTPLDDNGKALSIQDNLWTWVQKIDGDKVLLSVSDIGRTGTIRRDQVVAWDMAMGYFDGEIAKNPKNADAYWLRARLWLARNDFDRAMADLDQAIRLQPDQARFFSMRGFVWLSKGQWDQAMADSDKALQLNKTDVLAHVTRGNVWMSRKDRRRAHTEFNDAIRVAPTNASALMFRANCWELESNYDEAIKDRTEAIRLYPTNSAFLVARGSTWLQRQEHDKALADLNDAIKLGPSSRAYFVRALAWGRKHDRDKEMADISQAIKLEPSNTGYRLARADLWSKRGLHEEALADYDEVIRLKPDDPSGYVARGREWAKDALVEKSNPDKAIADYGRAIEKDPKCGPAYFYRARAEHRKQDYAGALRDWSALVRIEGDDSQAHECLARLLATCPDATIRDGKRALAEATRACELSAWKDHNCLDTLAAAYAENSDFPAAIKWQKRATEIARSNGLSIRLEMKFDERLRLYEKNKPCRE